MKIQCDTPPVSAELSNGVPVHYDAGKRPLARWRWWLLLCLVLCLPTFLLLHLGLGFFMQEAPAIVMLTEVPVSAPIVGEVQVIVDEGETVQKNDVLARLVPERALSLSAPDSGQTPEAQAVAAAQTRLDLLQTRSGELSRLQAQGAATRQEVEAAEEEALQAQVGLAALKMQQKSAAEKRLIDSMGIVLRAPVAGRVGHRYAQVEQWVQAGDDLLLLETPDAPWIEVFLPPDEMDFAAVGQKATLVFMDGTKLPGVVEDVLPEAQRLPADRRSPSASPTSAIALRVRPLSPLPENLRVHHLPLDVRFERAWPWT
ncbi:MAG: HlyD family efflux transporter periplasmic adaptor subunit [Zoogloeaceae bacterium]|jgi:multidrug resistance efflux pump|nr:HlyD family efflux transporter periplasmic adaptor subunit [Zoogloeaceae bacterium]